MQVPQQQQWHTASFQLGPGRGARPGQASFQNTASFNFYKPPHLQAGYNAAAPASSFPQIGMAPAESPLAHCPSNASWASNDVQEELNLHPSLNKLKKQTPFEADPTAILSSAMGNVLSKGLPDGALAERAIRQSNQKLQKTESQLVMAEAQKLAMAEKRRQQQAQAAAASPIRQLLSSRNYTQTIMFMRHGESEANISRRDVPDPNLTSLGLAQAESWQESVGNYGADVVLVSPLRRAVQTACHAFAYEEVPMVFCRFAREIGWSANENTIHSTPASMQEMLWELPRGDEIVGINEALIPAADDPQDEMASLQRLKVELARRTERTILVVCHFGVIATLTGSRAKNGDIYECEWGYNEDLCVVARHKTPLSEDKCVCG